MSLAQEPINDNNKTLNTEEVINYLVTAISSTSIGNNCE
jgi:hypothetical protein